MVRQRLQPATKNVSGAADSGDFQSWRNSRGFILGFAQSSKCDESNTGKTFEMFQIGQSPVQAIQYCA